MDYRRLSKFCSLVLRHAPHDFGLDPDEHGAVPLAELLDVVRGVKRHARQRRQAGDQDDPGEPRPAAPRAAGGEQLGVAATQPVDPAQPPIADLQGDEGSIPEPGADDGAKRAGRAAVEAGQGEAGCDQRQSQPIGEIAGAPIEPSEPRQPREQACARKHGERGWPTVLHSSPRSRLSRG